MDVTCDNCKAEYDFDDTLLGDKGTTVKCSKCGHVFRVMPPRREPTRSALKVRFRDGHIESVASLRDLQQRIQAGQVGFDDELGRDGFNYRRLGDVPELRNFFNRSVPASGPVPTPSANPAAAAQAASAAKNDLPHRGEPLPPKPANKRTVLGMGTPEIPGAPRMPNFGPVVAAQALAPTQPAAATPKSTLQGRAPISSAPTAPNMAIPTRDAPAATSPYAPISNAPTPTGSAPTSTHSAPTKHAPANYASASSTAASSTAGTPSATAPTQIAPANGGARAASLGAPAAASVPERSPVTGSVDATPARAALDGTPVRPLAGGSAAPVAQRPAGPQLRISESVSEGPMRSDGPHSPRTPGLDSIAPGALKAASLPQSGAPRAAGKAVRLSLEEDELPERQRSTGGGRWLLYLGAAVVLGGGSFFIARQLSQEPAKEAAALTTVPAENPAPAAAAPSEAADAAQAPVTTTTPAAPAPSAEAKPEEPAAAPAASPEPAPAGEKPAAKAATSPAKSPSSDKPSADRQSASEGAASTREPKDYAGWVSRGEQLLAKRDLAGAQQAFQTAVSLRGTGSEANSGLGSALLGLGQAREAIPFLTRAANNGFAEASVSLGDAYRKLGDKDSAIEAYETYLARLPRGARAPYVKLQLEGLGKDVGGAKPEQPAAHEPASHAAPSQDYRPAGELSEPAPAPENPQ
jgi:predicted Zn finger-like uncharacterized protein